MTEHSKGKELFISISFKVRLLLYSDVGSSDFSVLKVNPTSPCFFFSALGMELRACRELYS